MARFIVAKLKVDPTNPHFEYYRKRELLPTEATGQWGMDVAKLDAGTTRSILVIAVNGACAKALRRLHPDVPAVKIPCESGPWSTDSDGWSVTIE